MAVNDRVPVQRNGLSFATNERRYLFVALIIRIERLDGISPYRDLSFEGSRLIFEQFCNHGEPLHRTAGQVDGRLKRAPLNDECSQFPRKLIGYRVML